MAPNVTYEYDMGRRTNIKKSRKWAATPVYKMQIATYGVKTEESQQREGPPGCRASEALVVKHESRILGQWSNPVSGSRKSQDSYPWSKQHRA